jgi:hypothetical protein
MVAKFRDNGIGMSEEFQKIIFTPFSQESRSDIASNRGTGLGLAICKAHGRSDGRNNPCLFHFGQGNDLHCSRSFDAIPERPIPEEKFETASCRGYPLA